MISNCLAACVEGRAAAALAAFFLHERGVVGEAAYSAYIAIFGS